MALLCPLSSLFFCHFSHLRTDIRSLTYLLLFVFFLTHTSSILVSASLFPGLVANYNIISKQHCPHSLLTSSVSLSIITANRNGFDADPWCSLTLTLKLSVVTTAHLTTVLLPSYISCTSSHNS